MGKWVVVDRQTNKPTDKPTDMIWVTQTRLDWELNWLIEDFFFFFFSILFNSIPFISLNIFFFMFGGTECWSYLFFLGGEGGGGYEWIEGGREEWRRGRRGEAWGGVGREREEKKEREERGGKEG